MEVLIKRSLGVEKKGGQWHGRSGSTDCIMETASSEFVPSGGTRKLTRSLSLPDRWSPPALTTRWKFLGRIFDLHTHRRKMGVIQLGGEHAGAAGDHGVDGVGDAKNKRKKKKRSSWLPDRKRRWPIQGW